MSGAKLGAAVGGLEPRVELGLELGLGEMELEKELGLGLMETKRRVFKLLD